jgi:hypothetical protein
MTARNLRTLKRILCRHIVVRTQVGRYLTISVKPFANFPTHCLHIGIVRAVTRNGWWQIFPSTVDRRFDIAGLVE